MFFLHSIASATNSPGDFLDYLSRASVVTFLILVVYGGYKKWWVWSWQYNEKARELDAMREEKNAWRETALRSANVATQAFEEIKRNPERG